MDEVIELKRIENLRRKAAEIVARHGPVYLPIFERLEKEYELAIQRECSLQKAIELANEQRNI